MKTDAATLAEFRATVEQDTDIEAAPMVVFESIIEEMNAFNDCDGKSLNLKLEARPGGRWYRDLGHDAGHLWGHVQVIKPPMLLEITGPLMMSAPAINHLTYRITPREKGCNLRITHRMFGDFDPKMPGEVKGGWEMIINRIKTRALGRKR